MQENACRIDDFGPLPLVRPGSVAEIGDLVRRAAAEGQALYPLGGRTLLDIGLPPTRPGLGVDLRGLSQIIDYPARDMTITVQAGITLAELQALLATENQRLPIDVPRPEQATLGGALAANASGPRRLGFGTLRDYVIGISTVNDEGQEVKAGGRVVKNVAGYDLCKLHIGALGTLGIISQVTLKLRPRAGRSGARRPRLRDGGAGRFARSTAPDAHSPRLSRRAQSARPLAASSATAESVCPRHVGDRDWLRGQRRRGRLAGAAAPQGDRARRDSGSGSAGRRRQRTAVAVSGRVRGANRTARAERSRPTSCRKPSLAFCQQAATLPEPIRLHAHAGSGIVRGHLDGDLTLTPSCRHAEGTDRFSRPRRGQSRVAALPRGMEARIARLGPAAQATSG